MEAAAAVARRRREVALLRIQQICEQATTSPPGTTSDHNCEGHSERPIKIPQVRSDTSEEGTEEIGPDEGNDVQPVRNNWSIDAEEDDSLENPGAWMHLVDAALHQAQVPLSHPMLHAQIHAANENMAVVCCVLLCSNPECWCCARRYSIHVTCIWLWWRMPPPSLEGAASGMWLPLLAP